jgi:phage terminase large subunit
LLLNLINELNKYKWVVDKNGNKLNKPIDSFNHALDAVRYVALNKMRVDNNTLNLQYQEIIKKDSTEYQEPKKLL